MKWMEHFLSSGQLAGKITCPNKKCNAKLGNFDWAGIHCGCDQWVTPVSEPCLWFVQLIITLSKGFCVTRSKVDEVL
jgi:dual specificity phosphatase 12